MRKKYEQIVRLTLTGKMKEEKDALDFCYEHGYRIVRMGPKRISIDRVDVDRFKIVAERENGNEQNCD